MADEPSGEKAIPVTNLSCPRSSASNRPLCASRSTSSHPLPRKVSAYRPVIRNRPSGAVLLAELAGL